MLSDEIVVPVLDLFWRSVMTHSGTFSVVLSRPDCNPEKPQVIKMLHMGNYGQGFEHIEFTQ
jgi:predicted solute-binding protein